MTPAREAPALAALKAKKKMDVNKLRRIYNIMDYLHLPYIEAVKYEREDRKRNFGR